MFYAVLMFLGCTHVDEDKKSYNPKDHGISQSVYVRDTIISKFYPVSDRILLDSNSMIFSCVRTFDTSSLIHIQLYGGHFKVRYYEMLPAYHQNINDFSNENNELLFFEGYSFTIDSIIWKKVILKAEEVLQASVSSERLRYKDASYYALYSGTQQRKGDSNDEDLFEGFDAFLKALFLQRCINARKPELFR